MSRQDKAKHCAGRDMNAMLKLKVAPRYDRFASAAAFLDQTDARWAFFNIFGLFMTRLRP